MKSILLVEDDPEIVALLGIHLKKPLYTLNSVKNGQDGLNLAVKSDFDLIILDMMLPELSGLDICKKLRNSNNNTPVMMLTARADEIEKVVALELGADDYMTKPFGIFELMARIKALIRRSEQSTSVIATEQNPEIKYKQLIINKESRKVILNCDRVELTPKEFDLLFLLASNPGKSFTRKELLQFVWGYTISGYEHTVTAHINRLRIKIESNLNNPEYIFTSWGIGYRFAK